MKLTIPDYIQSIDPYVPGKPLEALEREYGISDSVKLASNENPLGPSPKAVAAIRDSLATLHRYPDGAGHRLIRKIADVNGVSPSNVVIGNGSDDIIALLVRALVRPGDRVIVPRPSFLMYDITATAAGATVDDVPLRAMAMDLDAMAGRVCADTRLVFVCNPNNPTGTVVSRSDFQRFMDRLPEDVVVVVDEAYIEFARNGDCLKTGQPADLNRPLVTLRTFSKAYGLAGLRVGYGIMPAALAEVLNRVRQPFNVNAVAQAAAAAALDDRDFLEQTVSLVHRGLDDMYAALDRLGLHYFKSEANFFLIDVGRSAEAVFEKMLRQGVIVRSMHAYGFPTFIRINVGLESENRRFVRALESVLQE
ncbi:histidinol-phosphate aminotransferase 2 [Desulfosarcina alkanivorans]|uniref:Histidinol-phosphate aminotransferase n=1 Tax=Desulfosarcina alkanivorans TaxID=571177 RepID=A0A5K7YFM1_9BACT|nr:histidinol-phosphate transaminase [Desulfosarcina alkanivorans]BBO66559.1 histidinol-phosphate aminotransferase 2 [Desulfosarcina alkanivorans]